MNSRWKILKTVIREYVAFKRFSRLDQRARDNSSVPEDFVENILSLGPTFIKLGQILSTRPDLLPPQYIAALGRLQEDVPSFDFSEAEKIIFEELQMPLSEAYAQFDQSPAASASLSQVHFAALPTGEEVAVKIQRPHLQRIFGRDLEILGQLLPLVRVFNRKYFDNLNLLSVFAEFRNYTLRELDFEVEGKTYERFRTNFQNDDAVIFPKVYWSHTTSLVLTMSKEVGLRLHEAAAKVPAEKRDLLNKNVIESLFRMFVRDGFFHADLHPGNIFFKEDGSIVLLDVGMFGELTDEQKDRFILYWLAVVHREKERAFRHLLHLTDRQANADERGFFSSYSEILDTFYESTIREKSLTETYLEILLAGVGFGFIFPSEMLLQAKALTTAEHIGRVLVPDFRFSEIAKPYVTEALERRVTLDNVSRRVSRSFPEWLLFGEDAPQSLPEDGSAETEELWVAGSRHAAEQMDSLHDGYFREVRHGEYEVLISKNIETVFNFVSRFACYPMWHPVYTEKWNVIHVSGDYIFVTPEAVGSVFRLDEIVDGYHLLSNGVITEFQRNRLFKWKAPFSILPVIELGTCLEFKSVGDEETKLSEYFFFSDSPLKYVFVNRKWFSAEALTEHIREELTGVKQILESGNYSSEDTEYLWEHIDKPVRFINGTPVAEFSNSSSTADTRRG
ncbi:MAG: hypothetical protein J5I65_11755 [Aridibacter famidurans]|nr:hypothetical protein [Aridibacter famidurans]